MSVFLVESKGMRILFDTGLDAKDSRLLPLLSLMGLTPADIGFIYLTHLHGDHIGGLMDGGRAVFPAAQVFVAKQEFRGWMRMPAGKRAQVETTCPAGSRQSTPRGIRQGIRCFAWATCSSWATSFMARRYSWPTWTSARPTT